MIDFVKGEITELTPTYAVIEAAGIGYEVNISLPTFSSLSGQKDAKLFVVEIIRDDAHLLYGFLQKVDRELFNLLTSVSGVGANTGRMIMSSYTTGEIRQIIATGNDRALSQIKGIGGKTAQRIVVDLKDKVLKIDIEGVNEIPFDTLSANNEIKQEAVSALTMLGFSTAPSGKIVDKILKEDPSANVEKIIRLALKML